MSTTEQPGALPGHWWGPLSLEVGRTAYLKVGPLCLWASRRPHEWRLFTERGADPFEEALEREEDFAETEIPAGAERLRLGFAGAPGSITLRPVLADRPVIVRPAVSFFVPPGEAVRMYVSTPLWVRIDMSKGEGAHELPVFRPSDTWFGPSTREGELCYASRSKLRLSLEELELRPHRAHTELLLKNRAADALFIDRLRVPVEHLSLFADPAGRLWTEQLTLVRESHGDFAAVRISDGPPEVAAGASEVAPARERAEPNLVVRAVQALFQP